MPYKSAAQMRYMNWKKKNGDLPGVNVEEMNDASKGLTLPERVIKKYAYGGDVQAQDIESYKESEWFQNPEELNEDDMSSYEPSSDVPGMGEHEEQADPYFSGGIVASKHPQASPSKKRDPHGIGGADDQHGDDQGAPTDGNERDFAKALRMRKIRGNRG